MTSSETDSAYLDLNIISGIAGSANDINTFANIMQVS